MPNLRLSRYLCLLLFVAFPGYVFAYSTGISGVDGYGGSTCANTGCHTGAPYASGTPSFTGATSLAVGATSAYTVKSTNSNAVKNGFDATVRDSGGTVQGSFSSPGTGVTNGTTYVTHSSPQAPKFTWSYSWTAPTTPGSYTMYACINQVNGDGSASSLDGPPQCGTYLITVTNTAPVANTDLEYVAEDTITSANTFNVLSNDNSGDVVAQTLSVTGFNTTGTTGSVTKDLPGTSTDGFFTYNPNSKFESLSDGTSTTDSFTYTLSDGYSTNAGTVNITINGANDAPVVTTSGGSPTFTFTEGDIVTVIDNSLLVSDPDSLDQISGATVVISGYTNANDGSLSCSSGYGSYGITGCTFSGGTLTLTGTTTTSNYQTVLRGVTYYNASTTPTTGNHTITFTVTDNDNGQGNGNLSASSNDTVYVNSTNNAPAISSFSGGVTFTEGGSAITVDTSSTYSDPDGTTLTSAVMQLTTNYDSTYDRLVCPSSLPSGITSCGFNNGNGKLTFTSSAGSAFSNFQTAMYNVKFNNTSKDPTAGGTATTRTVSLTIYDDQGLASATPAPTKTISITPVNDPPTITSTAPSSATKVITENVASNVYQVTQTDPDDSSFTYSLGGTGLAGATAGGNMAISSTGLITWTPPRTGVFNKATATVTVTVTDVASTTGGVGKKSTTQTFNLATSPKDTDLDGVADYSDNCPSVSNASQADMDNDTVHTLPQTDPSGIPANGDVDPTAKDANGFLTGGDACDEDSDGDGMPNTYEDLYSFLNPLDPTDAARDYDGDGITNLAEYLAGTPPDLDNVPPVVTAPDAVTVNSTGYLTDVDLGFASAIDGNDGSISSIVPIIDATISSCSELSNYPLTAPPFRPGLHVANWSTCDGAGNVSFAVQDVRVRPILSTTPGQTVGAGQTATVAFMLNGPAADYPVSMHYQLGGTASSNDYDISSGTLTINQTDVDNNNPGLVGKLSINIANTIAQDETLTIALSNVVNAVLGPSSTTQIDIVNHDTTPVLSTAITQNGVATGRTVYPGAGTVVLTINTSDTNTATAPAFDWSMTDNAISGIGSIVNAADSSSMSFNPSGLAAGVYPVTVTVNDGTQTNTTTFTLNVVASVPDLADCNLDGVVDSKDTTTPPDDCDGDGIDNTTEGAVDSNSNGIPDYLDDNRIVDRSVLQNETGDPANTYMLMTDPGLQLRMGSTALASGASGALVSQQNINEHGGPNGGAGANSQDSDSNDGGFYDFEVTGLNDSIASAHIVIPLQSAILDNAVYRNYNGSVWSSFVVDANNAISSAPGNNGVCPAPGSIEYTSGLTPLNTCVQLVIEDGGPNDADGVRDYVIRDPGGVGIPPAEAAPAPDKSKGGAGVLHPALLLLMLAVFSLLAPRRKDRS